MTAITVTIGSNTYPSYTAVSDADAFLAADVERATTWSTQDADGKARGLASATRLLDRLDWSAGAAPATDGTAPQAVSDACCLLAADLLVSPELFSNPSTASNVSSVGAGPARVSFFKPTPGLPLPQAAWDLIKSLLGGQQDLDSSAWGQAYGDCQRSRFDSSNYDLNRGFL